MAMLQLNGRQPEPISEGATEHRLAAEDSLPAAATACVGGGAAGPKRHGARAEFPHERLDAYRLALAMARDAKDLAEQIPRGHRSIADHLLRSSSNAVLLLAEGANRRGAAEKRQRFAESRGETGEVAAACDLVIVLSLSSQQQAESVKGYAMRLAAMLTGLIQRQS